MPVPGSKFIWVLIGSGLLSGCAARSYQEDGPPPLRQVATSYQTQVSVGDCVFKPQREVAFLGPIAAALLSSTISQGVNYVGKALQESAKATNDRAAASRNVEATNQTFGPCLQVVRGWFYDGFASEDESRRVFEDAIASWAAPADGQLLDSNKLTLLWQRRVWPAAQPDFAFEAEIVPASDAKENALALAPVYARLDAPISRAWLRPSRSREVAVFFAFSDAKSPASASDTGGGIAVGLLKPGMDRIYPPADPNTDLTPNRMPNESRWFTLAIGTTKKPMSVSALVTEHEDAQPFLQFVADVFDGAKAPVTTALQTQFVPPLAAAAQETEEATAETAASGYETALATALTAAEACSASVVNPVTTSSDIRGKVRTLNKAARAAGKGEFDEGTVPLSTETSVVRAGCARLRDQLRTALS